MAASALLLAAFSFLAHHEPCKTPCQVRILTNFPHFALLQEFRFGLSQPAKICGTQRWARPLLCNASPVLHKIRSSACEAAALHSIERTYKSMFFIDSPNKRSKRNSFFDMF